MLRRQRFFAVAPPVSVARSIPIPARSAPVCRDRFRFLTKRFWNMRWRWDLQPIAILPVFPNLTGRTIFTRTIRRTTRSRSCICRSAETVMWRSIPRTAGRSRSASMRSIWRRMRENSSTTTGTIRRWWILTVPVYRSSRSFPSRICAVQRRSSPTLISCA